MRDAKSMVKDAAQRSGESLPVKAPRTIKAWIHIDGGNFWKSGEGKMIFKGMSIPEWTSDEILPFATASAPESYHVTR